jgi:hypothetical protein
MLKDGLGKVLYIGPGFVTKWMGQSVAINPAASAAMKAAKYRLARPEDVQMLPEDVQKRIVGSVEAEPVQPKAKRPRLNTTTTNADRP